MTHHKVWDPAVRLFHWALVLGFAANAFVIDDDSALHNQLGYAVAALIGARVIWGLIGPQYARFRSFWPTRTGVSDQLRDIATARPRIHLGHTPLGALMIFNLLIGITGIALTGWMMTTTTFWGIGWVEELHELLVAWCELSALAHIAAVIFESRRTGVNLPKAMVTGVKTVPQDRKIVP